MYFDFQDHDDYGEFAIAEGFDPRLVHGLIVWIDSDIQSDLLPSGR